MGTELLLQDAEGLAVVSGLWDEARDPGSAHRFAHRFALRVYYEDTDSGGVVYYANYLKFAERARSEMMRLLGVGYDAMVAAGEIAFAVRHCAVDYFSPARLGDVLVIETRIVELSGAVLCGQQKIMRQDEMLARLEVKLACLNSAGRPVRIPAPVAEALTPFLQHQQD